MKSQEILNTYLDFYKSHVHKQIPNVSLVPKDDPTLLFVNSGVFPLVPYVFGEKHPEGRRLMNVQRCVRFDDLENVGDSNRHTIAFHMIGNWSLGDYFKKEQLNWIWQYYVELLHLDINKLYATVFAGDADAPKDTESIEILKEIYKKYGIDAKENERIFSYSKEEGNWWQRGDAVGEPGGPSSEAFYYIGKDGNGFGKDPQKHEDEFIEIGNSVFMEYKREDTGWVQLAQKNVDFGGGLERLALAVQGKQDIFETDNFWPIIQKIEQVSAKTYAENKKEMRIIADHMRSSVFIAMDGVSPSNKDQGYMLRRLLRRMVRTGRKLGITYEDSKEDSKKDQGLTSALVETVCENFKWIYPDLGEKRAQLERVFAEEEKRFNKLLKEGMNDVKKFLSQTDNINNLSEETLAKQAFDMYQSNGYPFEIFIEDVLENIEQQGIAEDIAKSAALNLKSTEDIYNKLVEQHKELSRQGATKKFTGGLADNSDQTIKYHTTTHLLHWALREVLGNNAQQMGSNITGERLRFDFTHKEKLSEEQAKEVERLVNNKIDEALPVNFVILDREDAENSGALHFFNEKYGEKVKVYYIGDSLEGAISKEFCGGPHVENTADLDKITLYKQEKTGKDTLRVYVKKFE